MTLKLIPAYHKAMQKMGVGEQMMQDLMRFKASERKDDPARRQGLHGPYEEWTRLKTGNLPPDYFNDGDPLPWGLRIEESRSTILWQVLASMLDDTPEFAAAYMTLALDRSLNIDEYARELSTLHKDWGKYLDHAGVISNHRHAKLGRVYNSVACTACSLLTAVACRDEKMNDLFKRMLPLAPAERNKMLRDMGLMPVLSIIIPGKDPSP